MLRALAPAAVRGCLKIPSVERWVVPAALAVIHVGFLIIENVNGRPPQPVSEARAASSNNGSIQRLWFPVAVALLLGGCGSPYPYAPGGWPQVAGPYYPPPRGQTIYRLPRSYPPVHPMPLPDYRSIGTMPRDEIEPSTPLVRDLPPERPRIERAPEPEPEPEPAKVIAKLADPKPDPKPRPVDPPVPSPAPLPIVSPKPPPVTPPAVERPCYRWFDPCHFYRANKS